MVRLISGDSGMECNLRLNLDLFRLDERHHATQLTTNDLDRMVAAPLAHPGEVRSSVLILFDPLTRKAAVTNLAEQPLHHQASAIVDYAPARDVIAVFRGIG